MAMALNKLTDAQRKFLQLTIKLHDDEKYDYTNGWITFTRGVVEQGEYSDSVAHSLNAVGSEFKSWRHYRKVYDDDLPF